MSSVSSRIALWNARARTVPSAVWLGAVLFLLAGLADGTLMPFFALWAHRAAGVPIASVGLLLGCYAGGELLATPLVGGIADRIGRRRTLLVSTGGIGAGFLVLTRVEGALPAGLVLLAIGGFESVLHPTIAAMIADAAAPGTLRRHYALTRMASGIGHLLGPAVGAVLAARSLGLVFGGAGVALLAGLALVAAWPDGTRAADAPTDGGEDEGGDEDEDGVTALLAVWRDRRLAGLLAPIAALGLAAGWIEVALPLDAARAGTLSASGIGLLFTWGGLVSVAFQWPVTTWSARRAGAEIVLLGGFLRMLAFGALIATSSLPGLVAAVTLAAFAGMLTGPLTQAIVAEHAPPSARGTYMAAFSAAHDLQDAAGPALGTALFAATARLPWLVAIPLTLAGSLALASAARRHEAGAAGAERRGRQQAAVSERAAQI